MNTAIKIIFWLLIGSCLSWFGWRGYQYFFDAQKPVVELVGLEDNAYYAGDVSCTLVGSDNYKVHDVTVWLDDNRLVTNHVINKKEFEYGFDVATKALGDGKHQVKVQVRDGSFSKNKTEKIVPFFVDNVVLQAALVTDESHLRVFQGRTLHVQFQVNKPLKNASASFLEKEYPCFPENKNSLIYECFIPVRVDDTPNEYLFAINVQDYVGNTLTLENKVNIVSYPFKKQRISVGQEKFAKERELGKPNELLEALITEKSKQSPHKKLWHGVFYVPSDLRGVSTEFGVMRTSKERGRYYHEGIDLLSPPQSAVWASQDGIVVIKDRFAVSGNTVVVDHGCGVLSLYFHLEDYADIDVGDFVKRGKPLGKIGKTGYATGYHLHWGVFLHNTPVDPMQWTKNDF